jgi:drug/metabolite transporter (DMT)-like permease
MIFIIVAALLWGITNPLLKRFSKGLESADSSKKSALDEMKFLLQRPKYLMTQGCNLLGSVAFFYSLRDVSVSTGSIAANSLAFLITVIMSTWVLQEGTLKPRTYAGIALVLLGTSICTVAR